MPELYVDIDGLTARIQKNLMKSEIYDTERMILKFSEIDEEDFHELIEKDPDAFVPFFTRICGLTIRECERLYKFENVYSLRRSSNWFTGEKERKFVNIIRKLLPDKMHIETGLYTFYKAWEEDQRRHYRGRQYEEEVREFFRSRGYNCEKVTTPIEVDAAIPPENPKVTMSIRTGVLRNFDKRAKEFKSEYDEITNAFPKAKFAVVFKIPEHQMEERNTVKRKLEEEHTPPRGKFDGIFFQDELEDALRKFEEWNIPKTGEER